MFQIQNIIKMIFSQTERYGRKNSRLQIEFDRIFNVVLKTLQMSHILTSAIRLR